MNSSTKQRGAEARPWIFSISRLFAVALGLVLFAAALLKAMDMELFIRQIGQYGIISQRVVVALTAWGLIPLECTLGVGLLVFYRPRLILSLTAILFLVFIGATTFAWLSGTTEHCGCFGAWMKHSPGQAALGNLVLLAATVIAWVGHGRLQMPQTHAKAWTVIGACLIGLVLPLAFGFSIPGIKRVEPKSLGTGLSDLRIHGLDHIDLRHGTYLIVLMSTDCGHCQEAVPQLNILAEAGDLHGVVALCTSEEPECLRFTEEFQPTFPIGQVAEDVFWRLLAEGDIPRFILVRDQQVLQVWDQVVPNEAVIKAALSG